jgi:hypothetical protein
LGNTLTVICVSLEEVAQLAHLDILSSTTQRFGDRTSCTIFLNIIKNPPEIASLGIVQYGSVKAKTLCQSQLFFTNREGREGRKEKKEMLN